MWSRSLFTFVVLSGLGLLGYALFGSARGATASEPPVSVGSRAAFSTSRTSLDSLIIQMRSRAAANPGDGEAAVLLADALIRAARVQGDSALPLEAERAIRATLAHQPDDYAARRMLGAVLLAQHRFGDALLAARDAARRRSGDAWNYAVTGDALLELGRYDEAFDAFDELNRRRPDPPGYARAAYARELQGDIDGAISLMQMAVEGTGAHDPEARAWYLSQLGHLYLLSERTTDAARAFEHAEFSFPGHPYARTGRAHTLVAQGRLREAYRVLAEGHDTPETWALRGDIARHLGDALRAANAYREAERLEREGWEQEEPQPAALARFLAERRLDPAEAVTLAERAAAARRDIYTMDALAWAYFQSGQIEEAAKAIAEATRTGTRDPRIRCHARAIREAQQGVSGADGAWPCDPLVTGPAQSAGLARP